MAGQDRLILELDELRRRVVRLEGQVTRLIDEDRIADEVAARIRDRRAQLVSYPVKVAVSLAAVSAIFTALWRVYMIAAHGIGP